MLFKSTKDFIALDQKGWLIGPDEDEKTYLARIEALNTYFSKPPSHLDHFLTDTDFEPALARTKELFGITPNWLVATYSNKGLTLFQGAATWINTKGPFPIPTIQLKTKFESGTLWGLYKREEILAHEMVHAARMSFNEPLFEEFFAYKTSLNAFRRFLGPLFQSPWEGHLFIFLLFVPIAIEVTNFFYMDLGPISLLRFLPLLFFGALFIRLLFLHTILHIAVKRVKNPKKKWAYLLHLTDKEIFKLALSSKKQLQTDTFRWKILKELF